MQYLPKYRSPHFNIKSKYNLPFYSSNMPKFANQRRKKRRFCGNRFTGSLNLEESEYKRVENSPNESENEPSCSSGMEPVQEGNPAKSASFLKLSKTAVEADTVPKPSQSTAKVSDAKVTGYRFVDMDILSNIFALLRFGDCCEFCLVLGEDEHNRKGCASKLRLTCQNCDWKHITYTSKVQGQSYEVNRRLVYSMRTLGKGHTGARKLCLLMNMPPPPTARAFTKNSRTLLKHVKEIATKSMGDSAKELKADKSDGPTNCGASFDGTWQKRGFSSLNGCVTGISIDTGKVLDMRIARNTVCKANFRGSAPAMEPEGVQRIFNRSVETHNIRYTEYYGDGDCKSFNRVEKVYEADNIIVKKKECIGHVQKRVGNSLRKLKRDTPGLGGKGKLTDALIDKLQNYYGIAIRSNVGNLEQMRKAIHASLMHCASNEARVLHDHCPTGSTSWLSEASLLEKCLHGKTQNQNKSLNAMIWQRVPKDVYVSRDILELGLYDAVCHFNLGYSSVLRLLEALKIPAGKYTEAGCGLEDTSRVRLAEYKSKEASKTRRKVLRGKRKKKDDKKKQAEGSLYDPGGF
ncbi:predicted protein [Nematostella vectensis]|uniref:Mutator-like transposase domain-containing protein n=1 Tax=Nematostella vectensis TaxID=45351 RepID=A7SIE9_NEMVE|nr:predicted protein [Nematostella vectensis]|eukprot:XP_001628560.1 predicted protein [Nematostella vectensis]